MAPSGSATAARLSQVAALAGRVGRAARAARVISRVRMLGNDSRRGLGAGGEGDTHIFWVRSVIFMGCCADLCFFVRRIRRVGWWRGGVEFEQTKPIWVVFFRACVYRGGWRPWIVEPGRGKSLDRDLRGPKN